MHTLVKTACVLHNLALAKAFGGPIFARRALRPAVISEISDEKQRGRVMATAWNDYNQVNVPAHVIFTTTWLIEREALRRLSLDHGTKRMIAFKDVLIAGALLTGIANVMTGKRLQKDFPEGIPVSDKPSDDPKVQYYRRYFRVMGAANVLLVGASLAMSPLIAGGVIRSERRGLLARVLGL